MKVDGKTMGRGKYKGLTKRQYKKQYGASEPGLNKGNNCKATGIDKAMAKYPRSMKTSPVEYIAHNLRKDRAAKRAMNSTFFLREFA